MRISIICLLLLCLPAAALGQYQSSKYSIERWDEDYSYLKDPSTHDDFFDRIKYMPLNREGDWYLSLGGQLRYRFDYFNNSEFGAGAQDEDGFHLFRQLYHLDAHFGPNLRAFVQVNSGLIYGREGGSRPGDIDSIDIQQAFADLTVPFSQDNALTVRVGRQELIYGAQRLIGPNDWINVRRTFDGGKLSFSMPHDTLDLFLVRPVLIDKYRLNSSDDHTAFAGIYNVTEFGNLLPAAHAKLDAYLLLLDRSKSTTTEVGVNSDTFTLGVRPHATPGPWDVDLEADWQFGRYDDRAINAYSLAAQAGYTFTNAKLAPHISLGLDLASGSPDPAHRFNPLFPPLYLYLGHLYLFGRQNIIDLHPELELHLTQDISLSIAEHLFWRQNTNDAVYGPTGGIVRAPNGSGARSIGNEFDISTFWQIDRHTSAYLGWAHFFTGTFVDETGPHSDADFLYGSVTYTF